MLFHRCQTTKTAMMILVISMIVMITIDASDSATDSSAVLKKKTIGLRLDVSGAKQHIPVTLMTEEMQRTAAERLRLEQSRVQINPDCKLVIYDFDQTITVAHSDKFMSDSMIDLMGGLPRIHALYTHFEKLQRLGVHLTIASRQSKNIIIQILKHVGLLTFFHFDLIRGGNDDTATWSQKIQFMEHFIKQFGCMGGPHQVMLVDDDNSFLIGFNRRAATCHVEQKRGLTEEQMIQIEKHFTSLPTRPYPYQLTKKK